MSKNEGNGNKEKQSPKMPCVVHRVANTRAMTGSLLVRPKTFVPGSGGDPGTRWRPAFAKGFRMKNGGRGGRPQIGRWGVVGVQE